jgi:hypothetical protein
MERYTGVWVQSDVAVASISLEITSGPFSTGDIHIVGTSV